MNCFQKTIEKMGLNANSQGKLGWLYSILILGHALYVAAQLADTLDEAAETPTGSYNVVDSSTNSATESITRLTAYGIAAPVLVEVKQALEDAKDKFAKGR